MGHQRLRALLIYGLPRLRVDACLERCPRVASCGFAEVLICLSLITYSTANAAQSHHAVCARVEQGGTDGVVHPVTE